MTSTKKQCLNCTASIEEEFIFCPHCGQETHDKIVTFKSFIKDFLGDYFTFDSKIFRSVIPLLFKPGFLTTEYLGGRRVKYILPLRLYIFISIIFFLLLSIESSNERISDPAFDDLGQGLNKEFFDTFFDNFLPKLFFVLLPVFALILQSLYRKAKRFYLGHFIFSLHFHSFVFLLYSFYLVLSMFDWSEQIFVVLLIIFSFYSGLYLFLAMRHVYQGKIATTLFKFILLLGLYLILLIIFSMISAFLYYQWRYG